MLSRRAALVLMHIHLAPKVRYHVFIERIRESCLVYRLAGFADNLSSREMDLFVDVKRNCSGSMNDVCTTHKHLM